MYRKLISTRKNGKFGRILDQGYKKSICLRKRADRVDRPDREYMS